MIRNSLFAAVAAATLALTAGQAAAQTGFVGTAFLGQDNASSNVASERAAPTSQNAASTGDNGFVGTAFLGQATADAGPQGVANPTLGSNAQTFGVPNTGSDVSATHGTQTYLGTNWRYQDNANAGPRG